MHLSLAAIIVVVPLLASATPLAQSPRVTIPISKTTNLHRNDGSLDVEALKRSVAASTDKIIRGFDTYQQNTGERHPSQVDNHKRAVGESNLTYFFSGHEEFWYGTVSVGTPAVEYTMNFDTGNSDLFLPGPSCDSSCSGHKQYNPSESSTSKPLNKSFSYPNGGVSGMQYTDIVKIEGLTAKNQTLGAATHYTPGLAAPNFPADGRMGMAFQSISKYDAPPVFQTLMSQGETSSPVFAFKMAQNGSELSIGGLDPNVYIGHPTYASVTVKAHWQIAFSSIIVGGHIIAHMPAAIIDSGMSVVIGPPSNVKELYKRIPGSRDAPGFIGDGYYTIPCDAKPPTVAFNIGVFSLPMTTDSLIIGKLPGTMGRCLGSIVSDDRLAKDYWVVGDAFMKNYYTIFDYGNSRVGFAALK